MNETVKKEQLRSYAEGILKPETVESIMYVESFADEAGDSEVWLLESDTGNEYWLIEGAYPANHRMRREFPVFFCRLLLFEKKNSVDCFLLKHTHEEDMCSSVFFMCPLPVL